MARLRVAIYAFVFGSLILLLYKQFSSLAYSWSAAAVMMASSFSGDACANYLQRYRRRILSAELELERRACIDPVTGLANRREFLRISENELKRHARLGKAMSVFVLDIEQLKKSVMLMDTMLAKVCCSK